MSALASLLATTVAVLAGPVIPLDAPDRPLHISVQLQLAEVARAALEEPPALTRRDCSGLVMTLLAKAGVPREGDTRSFWEDAVRERRAYDGAPPVPGDLVFFDDTWDANKNGRVDDALSHIAIVTHIEPDGTLVLVHKSSAGVTSLRMNLDEPDVHEREGRVLNDPLRAPRYGRSDKRRLSGQLFRGFAKPPLPIVDDVEPGAPVAHVNSAADGRSARAVRDLARATL